MASARLFRKIRWWLSLPWQQCKNAVGSTLVTMPFLVRFVAHGPVAVAMVFVGKLAKRDKPSDGVQAIG